MECIRLDSYLIKAFFRSSLLVEIVFKIARKKLENEKELLFIQRNIDKFYDIFVLQFLNISLFNCDDVVYLPFNRAISLILVLGTPSSSPSTRIFLSATVVLSGW